MTGIPRGEGEGPTEALDQLRKLQAVTDVALAYLTVDDLMDELLIRVRDVVGVDTAAILLYDEPSNSLVARAAKGIEEEVEQGVRIPFGRGFAGRIAAEQRPVIIERVDHSNVMNPILREKGIVSLLGVPLIVQGRFIGVMHVGTLAPRDFTDSDVQLVQLVGDKVAMAVYVGLYERERLIAETLQRSMLPDHLPAVFGVEFAARYVPAEGGRVGGDWYDAFKLPNGQVAIIVGDVVGRGLRAAAVMGRVRNALRAFAFEEHGPAEAVDLLNQMIHFLDPDEMATLIFGTLDPRRREFSIVNAGHLPALICPAEGEPYFIDAESQPPIGAVTSVRGQVHTVQLQPGSTVLLYTDGVVERRHVSLDDRLELLRSSVDCTQDLQTLADYVIGEVGEVGNGGPDDDMAIVLVRLSRDITVPYALTIDAVPARLAELRATLRGWLSDFGVPSELVFDILVATGEACANSIEHAYGPAGGVLELTLGKSDDYLEAVIRDRGRWRDPRGSHRGRGLAMMKRLATSVEVYRETQGTEIRLGWNLPKRSET